VPVEDVGRFEQEFLDFVQRQRGGIYDSIRETRDLTDDTANGLKEAVDEFRKGFQVSSGDLLVQDEPVEPADEEDVDQETVARRVRRQERNSRQQGSGGQN
jgi:F-type H+/Na+-transporting ATPase subunit alpha